MKRNGPPCCSIGTHCNDMHRFFIDPADLTETTAVLADEEARHLINVLRLGKGAAIRLFDGSGRTYDARITKIAKARVEATILSIEETAATDTAALHLGLALLKGKKTDFIIQKATELGVVGLHPFVSEFCVAGHVAAEREERRQARWQKIVREACKQCNRPLPPTLNPVTGFEPLVAAAAQAGYARKLIFWEQETGRGLQDMVTAPQDHGNVMVLIGPEGGFSANEVAAAQGAGFQPVTLGRRILRAETAALAAIAILQHLLGNLE
jgi:16S rRNA (uracil1498-N3)-methyltransferase